MLFDFLDPLESNSLLVFFPPPPPPPSSFRSVGRSVGRLTREGERRTRERPLDFCWSFLRRDARGQEEHGQIFDC